MKILTIITCLLFLVAYEICAQENKKTFLPGSVGALQYAGSTGLISAGYFRNVAKEKIEVGLMYGFTPRNTGGPLHAVSFKLLYSPFRIKAGNVFFIEPVQSGFFIAQHFGKDLKGIWPVGQYPPFYYWWPPSLRSHVFLSAAVSAKTEKLNWLNRISLYFEMNTNDLYIASFTIKQNHRSLSLYDIVFFGSGVKLYMK